MADSSETVIEFVAGGIDTVKTAGSFVLRSNVENLQLTGLDNIDGIGNELNDILQDNPGINDLAAALGMTRMS